MILGSGKQALLYGRAFGGMKMHRIKPFKECKRKSVDMNHIYIANPHKGIYSIDKAVLEICKMLRKTKDTDEEYTAALHTAMDTVYALGVKKRKAVTRGAYLNLVRALLVYSLCKEVGIEKTLQYLENTNYARIRSLIGGNLRYINSVGEKDIKMNGIIRILD